MNFASAYLSNKTLKDKLFEDRPAENTGIIIIIPAFNEPGIIFTLNSLLKCEKVPCGVEVLVLINAPANAGEQEVIQNNKTCDELAAWKNKHGDGFIKLLYHDTGVQKHQRWGVGMARKMAMDEAVRRFSELNRPGGVVVSLDADCTVTENYLSEIYYGLYTKNKDKACSIYFEHPLEGDLPGEIYDAIYLYELHLRYYYQALKYSGFPWVFHTIGSALAVKAEAYVRAGGMSKKQGAEDFYFIQKLIPAGGYVYLNKTCVIPSPRISDRVPFGTGPVMAKISGTQNKDYPTYNPAAFENMKELFDRVRLFYDHNNIGEKIFVSLHESLKDFLVMNRWQERISEIRKNTSSEDAFRKRFFNWFNMFRVVKYLNFAHSGSYHYKIPVREAAVSMLEKTGNGGQEMNERDLLGIYRALEK